MWYYGFHDPYETVENKTDLSYSYLVMMYNLEAGPETYIDSALLERVVCVFIEGDIVGLPFVRKTRNRKRTSHNCRPTGDTLETKRDLI